MINDEITQQWAQLVEEYGDLAYLMMCVKRPGTDQFDNFNTNSQVASFIGKYDVRRKDSAALPFDLKRAKAGDVVEWRNHRKAEWEILDRTGDWWKHYIMEIRDPENFNQDYRMKYPPKAKGAA